MEQKWKMREIYDENRKKKSIHMNRYADSLETIVNGTKS